jgi:hypothetical protein
MHKSASDADINKQVVQSSGLNLDRLREELIRQVLINRIKQQVNFSRKRQSSLA